MKVMLPDLHSFGKSDSCNETSNDAVDYSRQDRIAFGIDQLLLLVDIRDSLGNLCSPKH